MTGRLATGLTFVVALLAIHPPALADWAFSGSPLPTAFTQSRDMTLELQCERIRFAASGYEDAQDIERKQGVSIRFINNASTETGAFQAGPANANIGIVDNFPVEIVFRDRADYDYVLDQIARNAELNLVMIDGEVSYGIFDLKGSGAAIKSLRAACGAGAAAGPASVAVPEGVVYCGGGAIRRHIAFTILDDPQDKWNARVNINGQTIRAMTAYSYFGKSERPSGFVLALLSEDRSEILVFRRGNDDWLEFGDYSYRKCN